MSGAAAGLGTWLTDWLPLALAGGVGAACRWGVDTSVSRLSGRVAREAAAGGRQRRRSGLRVPRMPRMLRMPHSGTWAATALTVLGTGFLGGYSTFSTACVEGARLLLAGRWGPALAHATLMTAATLGAVGLGLAAGAALR